MPDRVSLRPVEPDDLPIFFVHQRDAEAARLAGFSPRELEAFMTHWQTNILGNPAAACRTILCDGAVAGNVGAWTDAGSRERLLGYWIGREFWGRGIASSAVAQFIQTESRPLTAFVAEHNPGSIRVLEKCGFSRTAVEACTWPDGSPGVEFVYELRAERG